MPRSVKEWVGRDDNHRAPKKVRDRLRQKFPNCYLCSRKIEADEKMALDHIVALINGGENRESNLRPVHQKCHATKTAGDVAEKAKVAAKRQKHLGIVDAPKMHGRPLPTTPKAARRKEKAASKLPLPERRPIYQEARKP